MDSKERRLESFVASAEDDDKNGTAPANSDKLTMQKIPSAVGMEFKVSQQRDVGGIAGSNEEAEDLQIQDDQLKRHHSVIQ